MDANKRKATPVFNLTNTPAKMKRHELYLCTGLILAVQLYQVFHTRNREIAEWQTINAVISHTLNAADNHAAHVDSILYLIADIQDTVKVIEQQEITNRNTYVTEISKVLAADSGAQFSLYRSNIARFDSLFLRGYYLDSIGP